MATRVIENIKIDKAYVSSGFYASNLTTQIGSYDASGQWTFTCSAGFNLILTKGTDTPVMKFTGKAGDANDFYLGTDAGATTAKRLIIYDNSGVTILSSVNQTGAWVFPTSIQAGSVATAAIKSSGGTLVIEPASTAVFVNKQVMFRKDPTDTTFNRADTQFEFHNDGTGHAIFSGFMKQNPPNITNEVALTCQAYNSAGTDVQIGGFYARWHDTDSVNGYSVIGMHANWAGGGSGSPELEVFGAHGIVMFGGAAATPPGAPMLQIKRASSVPSLVGKTDLVIDANYGGAANVVAINAYNAGNVTMCQGGGAVVPSNLLDLSTATAGQIKFPATANPSSDANTLDDYEENTWTPALSGVTATSASGTYTKIGRQVIATFNVTWPVAGAGTGDAYITNAPFAASATGGTGFIGYNSTAPHNLYIRIDGSSQNIRFSKDYGRTAAANQDLTATQILGTIIYNV